MKDINTKKLTRIAILIALTYLGSYLTPFPGILSTAAFDSMPGFFAAVWISPVSGGIVGSIGHFFSALLRGFPFSLPVHLLISVEMALICLLFGKLWSRSKFAAVVLAIVLNGVISPLSLVIFPDFTWAFLWSLVPVLIFATAANVVLAVGVALALPESLKRVG